jgi:two-component system nitrate/nitrite response regulator NarL
MVLRARARETRGIVEGDRSGQLAAVGEGGATAPGVRTVIVADDHAAYRAGITRAIAEWHCLLLVGEAGDGAVALRLIEELAPDVALLDVRMPYIDGLEVCAKLAARSHTRVVLLTAFKDEALAARAAASGAAECLSKELSREQICRTLVSVADRAT